MIEKVMGYMGRKNKKKWEQGSVRGTEETYIFFPFHPLSPTLTSFSVMAIFLRPVLFPRRDLSSRAIGSTAASLPTLGHLSTCLVTPLPLRRPVHAALAVCAVFLPPPHPGRADVHVAQCDSVHMSGGRSVTMLGNSSVIFLSILIFY